MSKIKNHPGFVIGNYSYDNDISLLKLREPLIFQDEQLSSPVCLPPNPPAFYEDGKAKANFSKWCTDCDFAQNPEERSMVMSRFTGYEAGNLKYSIYFLFQTKVIRKL